MALTIIINLIYVLIRGQMHDMREHDDQVRGIRFRREAKERSALSSFPVKRSENSRTPRQGLLD